MINEFLDEMEEVCEELEELHKDRSRAARRKANAKTKRRLRKIEPLTMSVRQTRNGGIIHKGNTYKWNPVWKQGDRRKLRYGAKMEIAEAIADDSEPFDAWADWNGEYFNENFPTKEDGTIDINEVLAMEFYCDDDDYDYEDLCSCFELREAEREIARYKDFLGEFNLTTLYERWLADNSKGKE
jgi:hypothetical protein